MIYAALVSGQFRDNSIFDLNHQWNRDNCFHPYYLLRKMLGEHGIQINTADIEASRDKAFELHMDAYVTDSALPRYMLMLETPYVFPSNGNPLNWRAYKKVFTWRDDLVDGDKFIKINLPNPLNIPKVDGWKKRDRFCCLIASNRALPMHDKKILYPERVRVIRWFEKNAPLDFDLYGNDWDIPVVTGGYIGKLLRRVFRFLARYIKLNPFPSYRGRVGHKKLVLEHTRFAICYENVCDLPGYISEKIFDCFFSGCIPIYWGANNVTDYIPADCFIDRRKFSDTEAVYRYMKAMTHEDFCGYQQRIANFLSSDAASCFSSEIFAATIVNAIVRDLGNES